MDYTPNVRIGNNTSAPYGRKWLTYMMLDENAVSLKVPPTHRPCHRPTRSVRRSVKATAGARWEHL